MTASDAVPASSGDLPIVLHLQDPAQDGYRERLRVKSMSVGRFTATAGYDDQQQPHAEDEVYYVLAGHAVLEIDGRRHAVAKGTLAYVPRGVEHRFVDVSSDLDVLVVFAPAESVVRG